MSYVFSLTALGMLEVSCGFMWLTHVLCIVDYSSRYVGGIVWIHVIYTCPMYCWLQLSVCWRYRVGPFDWHMSNVLLITALGMLEVSCGSMWLAHVLCIVDYSSRYVGGIVWVHVIYTCPMYCCLQLSVCWRCRVGPCDWHMSYVLLLTALGMLEVSCGFMWFIHVLCIFPDSSRYVGGIVWVHVIYTCPMYCWLQLSVCWRYLVDPCDWHMSYVLLITAFGMLEVSCGSMWLTHVLCIVDYSFRYVGGVVWVHVIDTCPMYCWLQLSVCWRCRVGPCDWHMSYVLLIIALGMLEVSCGFMWFTHVLCIVDYSSRYVGGIVWVHVIYTCPMYCWL